MSSYSPSVVRKIERAIRGPYTRVDGDIVEWLTTPHERKKKVHCETVLTESGTFCGIKGKNLRFAPQRKDITCKLCRMYFPPLPKKRS